MNHPNFTIDEYIHSNTADHHGIDNSLPDNYVDRAHAVLDTLQTIRDHVKVPLTITSGYRCPALNARVGGVSTSRHQSALAADIVSNEMTSEELFDNIVSLYKFEKESLPRLRKVIVEHAGRSRWVHLSIRSVNEPYERCKFYEAHPSDDGSKSMKYSEITK